MAYALAVGLLVGAVAVAIALTLQIHAFVTGRSVITARQLGLRIVSGLLLLIVVGMIYYGLVREWQNPAHALIYWTVLTLIPLMLIVLALIDLKETQAVGELRQAKLYTDTLRERQRLLSKQQPPEQDD
jgi:vacuolar-type H+-ATPase subunit I/STV1